MKKWYVLNTRPKKEFQVEKLFIEGGFNVYNPKYKQDNQILPFFAGYEFVQFEFPSQYQMVKYTRGVKRIIGNEEGPIPIGDEVILVIKAREKNGLIELEKYGIEPGVGDEIEVAEGPLKGLRGIFKKEMKAKERALILLNYVTYHGRIIIEKKRIKKVLK